MKCFQLARVHVGGPGRPAEVAGQRAAERGGERREGVHPDAHGRRQLRADLRPLGTRVRQARRPVRGHHYSAGMQFNTYHKSFPKIILCNVNLIANFVVQFHGHTHNDEFKVFYDIETNTRPINVAYVSPSVTSWKNMNPAYRIFTMDGDYDGSSHVSLVI